MVNVGTSVATTAWFLASAEERDALATVELLRRAADARLALEEGEHATAEVTAAWRTWYSDALESVRRLTLTGPSAAVDGSVRRARQTLGF